MKGLRHVGDLADSLRLPGLQVVLSSCIFTVHQLLTYVEEKKY